MKNFKLRKQTNSITNISRWQVVVENRFGTFVDYYTIDYYNYEDAVASLVEAQKDNAWFTDGYYTA